MLIIIMLIISKLLPVSDIISTNNTNSLLVEGLKAGLLSFGGAYTAIPFLESSMVGHYPAITQKVFLDGLALGGVIPAPLIIFGTYLGFIADGFTGAILITIGIFLPAFSFTLLGHKQLEYIINNRALHGALDGMSAAVVGLLVITALKIFSSVAMVSAPHLLLFAVALAALYSTKSKWAVPIVIILCGVLGRFLLPIA